MAENIEETLSNEIKNEDTNTGNNNGNNGGDGVTAAANDNRIGRVDIPHNNRGVPSLAKGIQRKPGSPRVEHDLTGRSADLGGQNQPIRLIGAAVVDYRSPHPDASLVNFLDHIIT